MPPQRLRKLGEFMRHAMQQPEGSDHQLAQADAAAIPPWPTAFTPFPPEPPPADANPDWPARSQTMRSDIQTATGASWTTVPDFDLTPPPHPSDTRSLATQHIVQRKKAG